MKLHFVTHIYAAIFITTAVKTSHLIDKYGIVK